MLAVIGQIEVMRWFIARTWGSKESWARVIGGALILLEGPR
jgi:hypothetical protein